MVILVDDLDLLSDYDKDLLRYIGYGIKQKTIVLAGTLTDSKKTTNLGFERVKLDPLSIQEITEMVSSTFHRIAVTKDKKTASTDEFVDWLYAYTDGNPLCGEELLRTIFTKEIMVFQTNAWKVDLSACKKTSIPSKIKDMISMRVSKCNNYELEVLRVLTLVDKPIESTLITETLQHDDEIVIEQLKGSGLILEHLEDSRRLVSMQNRHVAQTVYSGMHKRIRKQYLKKLINVIKKAAKTDDYYMPILSTLYMDIDDRESFYTWSLRAAKHAESIHDYYTAQEFYSKMLEYEDKILSDKGPETRLKLARLHYLLGEPTQAIKYSNEVLKSPRHDLYAGAYAHLGNIYLNMCDYKKAVSSIQKSLEKSATKDDQDDIECAIYSLLCMRTYEDDIIPVIIQPFPPSRNKTDVETLAEALYYQTIYDWLKGNFKSALTRAQETMHLSESKKLNRHYTYTQFVMSIIYHEQNDFNQAHVYIKKALAAFKGMKMDKAVAHVLCMYTRICVAHGNYSKACTLLDDIEVIIQQTDDQHLKYTAMIMRGHIAEDLGHFDEAVGLYNKAQTIAPKAVQPRVEISSVLLKKGVIDEAVSQLPSLRRIKSLELQARYMVLKATIDIHKGRVGNVHATVDKVAKTARQEIRVRAHQNAILLSSTLLYIKLGDFKSALPTLEEVKNAAHVGSKEAFVARVLVKACQVHVGELSEINVDDEIKQLKMMGCLYDVVYCTRIALESILARSRMADTIPSIINELTVSRDISKAIGAGFETQRIEAMLLELYPSFVHGLIDRQMSPEYLNMFTKIGELVNAHLGDDDFASSLLDLVIQATHADRGALFLTSTAGKLTFAAGRNMDQTTIKDARELSQTVLNEVKKDNIVITEDALADSNFSSKKSIIINRIRSLLCVPLSIHSNVIGALYLDSRKTSETFGIRDKDFLRAVANICASVIDRSAVFHALAEQNILLRAKLYEDIDESFVMGKSAQMNKVYQLINNAAKTQSPILLQGETGSGKGMLAQLIHLKSTRKNEKFIVINCGAIPDTLLESELFGHKKGSFTGAIAHKKGLLEEADKGTVLLDEIANTSPSFQAKLLDAIEMKRIRRIGETKMRPVDVRWIFATNRDLDLEVKQKNFREDLFYRINVVKIQVPPLRKRKKDIPILAQHFLKKYSQEMNKQIKGFSAHAQQKMMEYAWPGNVRELQNIIERTVVFVDEDLITDHELDAITTAQRVVSLGSAKKNAAKDTLIKALQASNWNVKKTAQLLGVDRKTVQRYIKKYSIKK
jgi:transcriptional regulator with GAF, ATPase, and Fis domain/tetratricopeptide (TPR) repeat protein